MWPFSKNRSKARSLNTVTVIRAHTMKKSFYGLCGMDRNDFLIILGKHGAKPFKSRGERVRELEGMGYLIDSVKIYPKRRP